MRGKNAGQLMNRCVCWGRMRFHPHPRTQLSGEHASTCTLMSSAFLMHTFKLSCGSIPSENRSNYEAANNIKFKGHGQDLIAILTLYAKTQQTSTCVSVSLQLGGSQVWAYTAVSETSCLWTVSLPSLAIFCWTRHLCSVFSQEVLGSLARCDG